jgi:membrane protein YdbS with pleckstrin-like domain
MNSLTVIISAITAFVIATGGALGVVFVGGQPTKWQVAASIVLGLGVAAKDTRSLLKLPPVEDDPKK